jgi:hypothetical protein
MRALEWREWCHLSKYRRAPSSRCGESEESIGDGSPKMRLFVVCRLQDLQVVR